MPKHVVAVTALTALMACAAAVPSETATGGEVVNRATGISCEVRLTPTSHGLRIEAMAHCVRAVAGEYELVISKSGRSGTSDTSQGGPFEASDDADVMLSASEFGVQRGDSYRANLVLRDESGVLCSDERRS